MGNYERAIPEFNRGLTFEPDDVGAYYCRGIAHYHKGGYERVIADFDNFIIPPPFDAQMRHAFALVDVADLQGAQFLTPQAMIEQRRQDRAVALTLQRLGRGRVQEHPGLVIAERRRHPVAVHRARPLHPQHRVMQCGVPVAEIGVGRRQRGELAPDGIVGQRLAGELLPLRDDMRARHVAELLGPEKA
jgi:hypothetical protein